MRCSPAANAAGGIARRMSVRKYRFMQPAVDRSGQLYSRLRVATSKTTARANTLARTMY
jgi:hypothetical protein